MSTTLTIYLSACLAWATRTTAGLTLEHCGGLDSSDRYAEVVSGNSRNELTCSGIDGITIEWKFNDYSAGICPPPPLSFRDNNYITTDYNNDSTADTCNMDTALPEVFVASRRSSSRSTLTINPVMLGPKVSFLQYITLRCLQQGNGVTTSDSCPLDYVRPANGTCVADVEDTSCCSQNGTITCDVSMGYSTHNRYGCRFFYRFGVNARQELGEWQPFVSSSSPFPDNDSAVSCFLAFSLSVPQGEQPEFSVMLLPGRSIVPAVVLSGDEPLIERNNGSREFRNGSTVIITNSAQAQYTVIIFPTLIIVIIAVIIGTLLLTRRYGCSVRRENEYELGYD